MEFRADNGNDSTGQTSGKADGIWRTTETSPAFWGFAAVFLVCLGHNSGWPPWGVAAAVAGLLAFLAAVRMDRRRLLAVALLSAIAFVRSKGALQGSDQTLLRALPRETCGGDFQLVVMNAPMGNGPLRPWDEGKGAVVAEVTSLQTLVDEAPREVSGLVLLQGRTPRDRLLLRLLQEGQILAGHGTFVTFTETPDSPTGFYGEYLKSRGIFRGLIVDRWRVAGEDESPGVFWTRAVRCAREELGLRLVRGIRDGDDARLLLALGLGLAEFIPTELRQEQVASGTVHVFAISGMHVGMVALMLAFLLKWTGVPLRWRWLLTGFLSGVYVILTGAAPSGVRALVMTLLVLYANMRWRMPSYLNTIGLAGCAALLVNPRVIGNVGFVYSYATVALLIWLAPVLARWMKVISEREKWIPRKSRRRRAMNLLRWCASGLVVSTIAWIGSSGISFRINGRASLAAPLVNIPLGTMVYLTLMLCPLKILAEGALPPGCDLAASVLEKAMHLTRFLASCGATSTACLPVRKFTATEATLFYAALLWLLARRRSLPGEKTIPEERETDGETT